jgi:hypothetical protein
VVPFAIAAGFLLLLGGAALMRSRH